MGVDNRMMHDDVFDQVPLFGPWLISNPCGEVRLVVDLLELYQMFHCF